MRGILFLLAAPLFALSNKITLYDTGTAAHTNEPRSDQRLFADGEFCGTYPQPYIDGVAVSAWQTKVITSWASGCVREAQISYLVSIASGGSVVVDFRANAATASAGSGLSKSAMLAFNGGAWGAKIQGTASGVVKSASARTILAAVSECPADAWDPSGCYKYLQSGPVVTQIILFGGTLNSFGWECDSGGGTCPAVSPYTSTVWKSPTDVKYNSIHPIFVMSFYTGWAGVKTEFILENSWFRRLQDQKFDLELFNGAAETTSVYTKPGTVFYALRRAREIFWDGAAPTGWLSQYRPGVRVDYNRQYLLYSKAVPFLAPELNSLGTAGTYDLNSTAGNLDIVHNIGTATEAQWCNGSGAQCGPQAYSFPSGGTKPELGIISRAYARYLVSFSADLYEAMLQIGLMAGAFPFHVRESDTGLTYTAGHSVNAFGKPFSLDARPLVRFAVYQAGTPVGSRFSMGDGVVGTIACLDSTRAYTIGCTVTDSTQTFNRWTIDDAHSPRAAYIPYVITGDWYFLEEQQFAANQALAVEATGSAVTPGCSSNFARRGEAGVGNDWGIPAASHNIRVEAWGTLHIGQTAMSMPDNSPEKTYYNSRLQKIIDVRRGMFGITPTAADYEAGGSSGDPCPSAGHTAATATPWCWGFVDRMERKANPMALTSIQGTYTGWGLNLLPGCASNQWFELYMRAVYGWLNDMGHTQFEPMVALMSKALIKQAIQSNAKGATLADYSTPMTLAATGNPVQSIADIVSTIRQETTLRADIASGDLVNIPVNHQFVSVNCSAANAVWMGGIGKLVIDPGTADEEFVETLSQPSCTGPGTYVITLTKRGLMGTTARAHLTGAVVRRTFTEYGSTASTVMDAGYGVIAQGAFAFAYPYSAIDEVTGATLTGRRAWESHRSYLYYQDYLTSTTCSGVAAKDCQNPMWAFRPRHLVTNVRAKAASGQVQFWYTAPTADACKIGVSATAFASTDDSSDTASTGNSLSRTLAVTGLSSGTYNYRITCGPFGGTARVTGSFTL